MGRGVAGRMTESLRPRLASGEEQTLCRSDARQCHYFKSYTNETWTEHYCLCGMVKTPGGSHGFTVTEADFPPALIAQIEALHGEALALTTPRP